METIHSGNRTKYFNDYYHNNKDKIRVIKQRYFIKNKENISLKAKINYQKHKDYLAECRRFRRLLYSI